MLEQFVGLPRIQSISVESYPYPWQAKGVPLRGAYRLQTIPYGSVLHFPLRRFVLQMRSETEAYLAIGPEIPCVTHQSPDEAGPLVRSAFPRLQINHFEVLQWFIEDYQWNAVPVLVEEYGDTDKIPFGPYRGHGVLNVVQDEKRRGRERLYALLKFEKVLLNALPENFVGMISGQFDIPCIITFEEVH